MNALAWAQREPVLKATPSEFLGKNRNTLPNTRSYPKKWQILRQTQPVSSTVQQYQSFLMLAIKRSLEAEPGTNPQAGASHLPQRADQMKLLSLTGINLRES
jgi:hypothetical protein